MVDNRFDQYPVDTRFPEPGTDTRFPGGGVDERFPGGGLDGRFMVLSPIGVKDGGVAVAQHSYYDTHLIRTSLFLKYRKESWNKEFNPDSGTWVDVVTGASKKRHDLVDFELEILPNIRDRPVA